MNELGYLITESRLHILEVNISFSDWEYELNLDKVHLCIADYNRIYWKLSARNSTGSTDSKLRQTSNSVGPKEMVSFICICLSIVCLLVTIVVYILLTDLHSQPGVNNIILCIFLLLAQSFYQFGAGQRSLSYWACTLIGILCHFF